MSDTPIGELLDRIAILRGDDCNPHLATGTILFVVPLEHARILDARFIPPGVLVEVEADPRRDGFWRIFWAADGADVHDVDARLKVQRWGYPESYPRVDA